MTHTLVLDLVVSGGTRDKWTRVLVLSAKDVSLRFLPPPQYNGGEMHLFFLCSQNLKIIICIIIVHMKTVDYEVYGHA